LQRHTQDRPLQRTIYAVPPRILTHDTRHPIACPTVRARRPMNIEPRSRPLDPKVPTDPLNQGLEPRPIAGPSLFLIVDEMPIASSKHATALPVRRRAPARHILDADLPSADQMPDRGRGRCRGSIVRRPKSHRGLKQNGARWSSLVKGPDRCPNQS
jgi:hypothetical protein